MSHVLVFKDLNKRYNKLKMQKRIIIIHFYWIKLRSFKAKNNNLNLSIFYKDNVEFEFKFQINMFKFLFNTF